MDGRHFDALTRDLSGGNARRRLIALVVALPVLGSLFGWNQAESGLAKDRRRRRKQRHQKRQDASTRKRRRDRRKHACRPKRNEIVCAGTCGMVTNRKTCGKPVDCGPCGCDADSCANPTPICAGGSCVPCSPSQPCPAGSCCQGDGACVATCPDCQICIDGLCGADGSQQHTCDGPCPLGEWCDAGACASIQATVTFPDCQSLCSGSTDICGQTVTCPDCSLCFTQTGCSMNLLPNGPVGSGTYCSSNDALVTCKSDADCATQAPFSYCNDSQSVSDFCTRLCPY